ncbi:MAG TPA: tetraacyldisaccharide 4'-kinase [Pyrinomonadaceae bacterium]|nr:tetraacyldisaccharide 4'-kinase [Pyrinomonadaceae bacterium]
MLHPVSAIYGAAVRARLSAYSKGLLSPFSLGVPTISVGNITAGGTGKTPMVEWLCRKLSQEGRKVGVLTRGYRRDSPQSRVLVSDGISVYANAWEAGDEAFLLAERLVGVAAVISDANRTAAGRWARDELGLNAFVLDDGFQHLQLSRDLDLLLIDATDPWGGNSLLPLGRLREPVSGLRRADCIVITRAEEPTTVNDLITEIKAISDAPRVLSSRMRVRGVELLNEIGGLEDPRGKPMAAFCGIGNPNAFFNQLRRDNYNVVLTRAFPDHHRYNQADIEAVVREGRLRGAQSVVTTAKDAVKLRELKFSVPCYVLEIEVEMEQEATLVDLIRSLLSSSE